MSAICMKLDPGMHIGLHFVFFGKTGVAESNFITENYTWMDRSVYKCSRQDPEAAYGSSSARTRGRLQL
jgi:hypothetical protein